MFSVISVKFPDPLVAGRSGTTGGMSAALDGGGGNGMLDICCCRCESPPGWEASPAAALASLAALCFRS